jgi:hypothetical protein
MLKTNVTLKAIAGVALSLATLTLNAAPVSKEEAQRLGLKISQEAKKRDTGWTDSTSDMLMVLRNKQGQESIREIKNKTLELLDDGDKSLTVFNKPRDVKGTSFLSFSHTVGNDDQWLYLPSLKRVKRISSRNKSGPFMGSEFSFEDIASCSSSVCCLSSDFRLSDSVTEFQL